MKPLLHLTPFATSPTCNLASDVTSLGVTQIQASHFWDQGFLGQDVVIAILDTGCDCTHPSLKDHIIGVRNFTPDDKSDVNNVTDYNGHGTHVAGTIAATMSEKGVIGVAPEAKLLILKVLNAKGSGSYEGLIEAIHYATEQEVDIISLSLGGPMDYRPLHEAIQAAVADNISVVCAAANSGDGNASTNELAYPGYYAEVISVGAATEAHTTARFSNSHDQIDLMAPGTNILSTYPENSYASLSGTSMATPHVSGALALLINWGFKTFGRRLTEYELYAQLIRHCVPLQQSAFLQGSGLLYLPSVDLLTEAFNTKHAPTEPSK